jgi:hypothetical protein
MRPQEALGKKSRKGRIITIGLLVDAPIAYLLQGYGMPSYVAPLLLGITIGVYVTALWMIYSIMKKLKAMEGLMNVFGKMSSPTCKDKYIS